MLILSAYGIKIPGTEFSKNNLGLDDNGEEFKKKLQKNPNLLNTRVNFPNIEKTKYLISTNLTILEFQNAILKKFIKQNPDKEGLEQKYKDQIHIYPILYKKSEENYEVFIDTQYDLFQENDNLDRTLVEYVNEKQGLVDQYFLQNPNKTLQQYIQQENNKEEKIKKRNENIKKFSLIIGIPAVSIVSIILFIKWYKKKTTTETEIN